MKTLKKQFTVKPADCANMVGSGGLEVLATPTMVAWMENTALALAAENLNEGDTTVGIAIAVEHTKASKIGENIECEARLTATEGRKLTFEIECRDSKGETIGTCHHDRFIVNCEKFMKKVMG